MYSPCDAGVAVIVLRRQRPGRGPLARRRRAARSAVAAKGDPPLVATLPSAPYFPVRPRAARLPPPGTRVPTIVVSPFAKKGFVDHTQYDTISILKTIELRWNLAPLGTRDTAAAPLTNAFTFTAAAAPAGMPVTGVPEPWLLPAGGGVLALLLGGLALRRRRTVGSLTVNPA